MPAADPSFPDPAHVLWNDTPATEWLAAFPIGNGRIGGMVFGDTERERIALNHENLWRGTTRDRTTPDVANRLPEIREAFFGGDMARGAALAEEVLGGHGQRIMPYQPVGNFWLEHGAAPDATVSDYRRELDVRTGIASTRWSCGESMIVQEAFVSAVHNVLVVHLTTTAPEGIDLTVRLDRQTRDKHPGKPESEWVKPDDARIAPWASDCCLGFTGTFPEGISFATEARVMASGRVAMTHAANPGQAAVRVRGADDVVILLAMAVAVEGRTDADPADEARRLLDAAPMEIETLKHAHLAEHEPPMRRVSLDLPVPREVCSRPLRARLERLRAGEHDPALSALWFHYGRYLLFSSSRGCDQPANLQGIWCEELSPPWQSDFHLNINLQMNYWPAEVGNLPECVPPLVAFIERFVPSAREAARDLYGAEGVTMPHGTDVWGRATPEAPVCDVWQGAAAWLAQHLWWRWEFSNDRSFLETHVYPYLKDVAAFWMGFLVPEARDEHPLHGRLVSVPSNSPENSYAWEGHRLRYGIGATMDLLLAREVLTNCLAASEILGVDDDLRPAWEQTLRDLAPLQVGRFGQLQEWVDDWEEPEPAHRHVSHLYGVFPGNDPIMAADSALIDAARRSLERRLEHGGGHTGWSRSWIAALWARFCEGDLAGEHLDELVRQFATDALFDLHPPRIFQIDGNLGGTAAVAEMLLQSHRGIIRLLPALPTAWSGGEITGLRARGRVTVSLRWTEGRLTEARLTPEGDEPITIELPDSRAYVVRSEATLDDSVEATLDGRRTSWTPTPGTVYVITPS